MMGTFYPAWRYLSYHRLKTGVLIISITRILFLPVGLKVLMEGSTRQPTARAGGFSLGDGRKPGPPGAGIRPTRFLTRPVRS